MGSSSFITNLDSETVQHVEYVPFGEVFIEERNNVWNTPYLFNAKELDEETGLYYYGARYYDPRVSVWLSTDPSQEKYPNISTYTYAARNPVKFIDPDGRDVWEINNQGKIVNQIKDKNQDAFYIVDKNGNNTFTTDADGNKHYNSISFEYGTITDSKKSGYFRSTTSFAVNSESSGAELFKFFADNTKMENGLINTQNDGSTVMTNHKKGQVNPWSFIKNYHENDKVITSITHNHPQNSDPSGFGKNSKSGDKFFADALISYLGYSPENYVYQQKNNNLVLYDNTTQAIERMSWGLVFRPSAARKHPVYPIRQYPGVGLSPP